MNKEQKQPLGISLPKIESFEALKANPVMEQIAKITQHSEIKKLREETSVNAEQLRKARAIRPLHDLKKSLEYIDIDFLKKLQERMEHADFDFHTCNDDPELRNDLSDALRKFIETFEEFERLNSEDARKLAFKEAELEIEHKQLASRLKAIKEENRIKAKYDWGEKWRHLFVKSLGTTLFIALLLYVGWLVKTYEWAELPYSSLFKTIIPTPKLGA